MFGSGERFAVDSPEANSQGARSLEVFANRVGERYFDVMGLPIRQGRGFDSRDLSNGAPVVIVNDVLAAQLFGNEPAAGRAILLNGQPHEIVGVVPGAEYHTVLERPRPFLYLNYWQRAASSGWAEDSRTHVRVSGDPAAALQRIRREIAAIDPAVPVSEDYPLSNRISHQFRPVRLAMTMFVGFGVLAFVLTVIGLYGVVSFATTMRTREIAIRMALGATRSHVRALVVKQGVWLASAGAALGLLAAAWSTRLLSSLLYGVQSSDFATFSVVPIVLLLVALTASWLPARRAMAVDPSLMLRRE